MCNCQHDADEEMDITQELTNQVIDKVNEFSDQYYGKFLEHHTINSLGASLIMSFRCYKLPPEAFRDYCQWMLEQYVRGDR